MYRSVTINDEKCRVQHQFRDQQPAAAMEILWKLVHKIDNCIANMNDIKIYIFLCYNYVNYVEFNASSEDQICKSVNLAMYINSIMRLEIKFQSKEQRSGQSQSPTEV